MSFRQVLVAWSIVTWAFLSRIPKRLFTVFTRLIKIMFDVVWRLAKLVYKGRNVVVGVLILVLFVASLLMTLNHFIGFQGQSEDIQQWLSKAGHWKIVLVSVSAVLLVAWDYVSPTLRTLFGDSWLRAVVWGMVGMTLIVFALAGWPEGVIAYRYGNLGCLILYIVAFGLVAKVLPPKSAVQEESLYIEDNPKVHSQAVLYESQTQIINDIQHLIVSAHPSTFAISGRWGIGKTFLLQRAMNALADDKTIIWVDFEPWRYASEEALIRGFYEDIGKKLAKDIPGIQHIARPLVETTEKFVKKHDGSGIVGSILDMLRAAFSPPVKDTPETQIGNLLKREGKRLVLVIDDVERSFNAERIFRTLQLAHFAKGIDNVQVVFLCDKDVVLKARPQHFGGLSQDSAEYLEKFVEREVVVPSPRPQELRQLFSGLMDVQQQHQRPGFDFSESDLPDGMLSAVATPRGVIRLFNEFAAFRINAERNEE